MWKRQVSRPFFLGFLLVVGGWSVSCTGGSGGFSAGATVGGGSMQLTKISVLNGAIWEINREIEFTFTAPIDFMTVNSNTINIQSSTGAPATGSYFEKDGDPKTVVFQPNCPTLEDLSDSGFRAGGVQYVITVFGTSSGTSNTVRSKSGGALETTQTRTFSTPASTDPAAAFLDTTLGPPVPVVRGVGDGVGPMPVLSATYMELGDDATPEKRVYFEFDQATQTLTYGKPNDPDDPMFDPVAFRLPLNLYSADATRVAIVIEFNQPVNPSSVNISSNRLRLEFMDSSGTWRPIDTRVTLEANCTQVGARVRLEPIGILPQGTAGGDRNFRAVVLPGFQDLVGQTNLLAVNTFAVAPTDEISFGAPLTPADETGDEFLERFLLGGSSPDSFQDTSAVFDSPAAIWDGGRLSAAFTFQGTGGPGGDFDWVVDPGEIFFFDTNAATIVGGPGGIPTRVQNSTGGFVDVRDLIVMEGGEIRVQGPNPMIVNASGVVRINGKVDLGGFNAKDVATLNTGNQAEVGGAGAGGGGPGGSASVVLNNSTPRGTRGGGPFGQPNTGGEGGEGGFAPGSMGKDARRPGGGGGGRFAADACVPILPPCMMANNQPAGCNNASGLYASAGCPGESRSRGATTGVSPALGGDPGVGPFVDGDPANDFLGVKPVTAGSQLIGLIRGELSSVWAGYGGGGGGDAIPANSFPHPNWSVSTDEKGGGGGGGAGSINVKALGSIIFGPMGEIVSVGGQGGTGENTIFLDHVGGTGGSGSGGHIVLESATNIDFTDEGNNITAAPRDWIAALGGRLKLGSLSQSPPIGVSHGGQGGPGIIQLHVPDPVSPPGTDPAMTDIVVPISATIAPDPLDEVVSPAGIAMIPTFGARSRARSKWISIGGADQNPNPMQMENLVRFLFDGVDTTPGLNQGKVLASSGQVAPLTEILGPNPIDGAASMIEVDAVTLRIDGDHATGPLDDLINDPPPISNDIYLRTPSLLTNFVLRLQDTAVPTNTRDFTIESATFDQTDGMVPPNAINILRVMIDGSLVGTLQEFVNAAAGPVQYFVIPRFFRVITGNVPDTLPDTAFVRITFEATGDDGFGQPNENNILVPSTGDISDFNNLTAGELQFFRFEIEFDLDAQSMGVSVNTQAVELEFLRVPFRF